MNENFLKSSKNRIFFKFSKFKIYKIISKYFQKFYPNLIRLQLSMDQLDQDIIFDSFEDNDESNVDDSTDDDSPDPYFAYNYDQNDYPNSESFGTNDSSSESQSLPESEPESESDELLRFESLTDSEEMEENVRNHMLDGNSAEEIDIYREFTKVYRLLERIQYSISDLKRKVRKLEKNQRN